MDPDELLARDGEHPERVRVAEVFLAGEREVPQVVARLEVVRHGVCEAIPVEGNLLLDVLEDSPEPRGLERPQVLARESLSVRLVDHRAILARHGPRAPDMISGVPAERDELLWRAAERAGRWALESQATVQTRFGNFLLADSFLLLSWATVYSDGSRTAGRVVVLAVLAMTSVLLAAAFALLGSRYAKYDRLQWDLAAEAEERLPPELRLIDRVQSLRRKHAVESPSGSRYELTAAERWVSISRLLVWAPVVLGLASLVLLVMSFLPR
jgi:hypothetical protein